MSEPRIREANLALDAIDDIEFCLKLDCCSVCREAMTEFAPEFLGCPCGFVFERVRFQHWIAMGEA